MGDIRGKITGCDFGAGSSHCIHDQIVKAGGWHSSGWFDCKQFTEMISFMECERQKCERLDISLRDSNGVSSHILKMSMRSMRRSSMPSPSHKRFLIMPYRSLGIDRLANSSKPFVAISLLPPSVATVYF